MTTKRLLTSEIRAGVWHAEIAGDAGNDPQVQILHQQTPLADVTCSHDPERAVWKIAAPIPSQMINDGIQTFMVKGADGELLADFSILAGHPLASDLRAEISLLRAELEILKTAFRKHCAEN